MKIIYSIIYLLTIFLLIFSGFLYKEIFFNDNDKSETILFEINNGETLKTISENLEKQNIINNKNVFYYYLCIKENPANIKAGTYNFNTSMIIPEISNQIIEGNSIKEKITILEGWTINDIAEYLNKKEICSKNTFLNAVKLNYSNEFNFINNKNLEGFLFPDTYYIGLNDNAEDIIKMMLRNFENKIPFNEIEMSDKNLFEIITMASIIEKEARGEADKKMISGLLWKRLDHGIPLQVDATVIYANKINNTNFDTYKNKGLPIGPISTPGMESILAALYPTENIYWYYLSTKDGTTIFSKDFEEHKQNKWKYLR